MQFDIHFDSLCVDIAVPFDISVVDTNSLGDLQKVFVLSR